MIGVVMVTLVAVIALVEHQFDGTADAGLYFHVSRSCSYFSVQSIIDFEQLVSSSCFLVAQECGAGLVYRAFHTKKQEPNFNNLKRTNDMLTVIKINIF